MPFVVNSINHLKLIKGTCIFQVTNRECNTRKYKDTHIRRYSHPAIVIANSTSLNYGYQSFLWCFHIQHKQHKRKTISQLHAFSQSLNANQTLSAIRLHRRTILKCYLILILQSLSLKPTSSVSTAEKADSIITLVTL